MFEANNQVQAWPTAEMFVFVKRGPREVFETPKITLSLVSMVQLVPITDNVGNESAKSNVSLVSITVTGAFNRSVSDNAKSNLSLVSIVSIVPIIQSQSETTKSNVSLLSMLQLLPVNQTPTAEAAKSTISLVSIIA